MRGTFVVLIDDQLYTYNEYEQIPERFDNLIKFQPEVPPPPHSATDHEWIGKLPSMLRELLNRETRGIPR